MTVYMKSIRVQKVFKATRLDEITRETNIASKEKRSKCWRKGDPFQGLKLGSCLMVGNELSEETHVLTKQEILLRKGTQVESKR